MPKMRYGKSKGGAKYSGALKGGKTPKYAGALKGKKK